MYREWAPNAATASLVGDFSKSPFFFTHIFLVICWDPIGELIYLFR